MGGFGMKKLKVNQEKIKKVLRNGMILTTSSLTLMSFSGCNRQIIPNDYPTEYEYINQENNEFDSFHKSIIRDGKVIKAYNKENISIAINKETFDIKEYIYNEGVLSSDIYDLETGYLIVNISLKDDFVSIREDEKNWETISNNAYIVDFKNLEAYIEGEPSKDFYTIEEIKNLEPKIVESVKLILEYEKAYQKVK